jgi:hypothetical protein
MMNAASREIAIRTVRHMNSYRSDTPYDTSRELLGRLV